VYLSVCCNDFRIDPQLGCLLDSWLQVRYVQTVVARVFYTVNTAGNERLSLRELQRSRLMQVLQQLEHEDDINAVTITLPCTPASAHWLTV